MVKLVYWTRVRVWITWSYS